MTKKTRIAQIVKSKGFSLTSKKGKVMKAQLTRLSASDVTQLHNELAAAGQQMIQQIVQQQFVVQQRKPAKKATAKKGKGKKAVAKPTDSRVKRAREIAAAIRAGRISAKNSQIVKYTAYAQGTRKQKVDRFVKQYAGVRIPAKKKARTRKPKRQSVAAIWQGLPTPKDPYFLSRGYHVDAFNVGGGRSGPGTVRKIAGKQGAPFGTLTAQDKKKIISFLNSPTGRKLRGVGAREQASLQKMQQAKQAATQARRSKAAKAKASKQKRKAQAQRKQASANVLYGWF